MTLDNLLIGFKIVSKSKYVKFMNKDAGEVSMWVGWVVVLSSLFVILPGLYIVYKFINYLRFSKAKDSSSDRS